MSAGAQLQMAPQSPLVQVNQSQTGIINPVSAATSAHHNNQDSNMSTGSSHSDKEIERDAIPQAIINSTPEKLPRSHSEVRKRKRKPTEDNGNGPGIVRNDNHAIRGSGEMHNSKGPRISLTVGTVSSASDKKINDYFHTKHQTNSPRHPGAKSPSPQLGQFPMYPPSPQPLHSLNQDYFSKRTASNIVPVSPSLPPPPVPPQPTSSNHQPSSLNSTNNLLPLSNVVVSQTTQNPQLSTVNNGLQSAIIQQPPQATQQQNHQNSQNSPLMVSKLVQTDLTFTDMIDRDTDVETSKTKLDDLNRLSEEQKSQIAQQGKVIEQHKSHINKCIDVVKKLLKQKSNIEKKEARQKCMQNRLRLGQFVTQRVGATFQENWTDGYAFQELSKRQEEITAEREEIDRQKKSLMKKRPTNESGRKRNNSSTTSNPSTSTTIHNGGDVTFLKPDPVSNSSTFTLQEYYECDEILKLRQNALKKEDADLQLEMEKLERERNLHIRELKRIHNEDQVRPVTEFFTAHVN